MKRVSGNERIARTTFLDSSLTDASDASGEAWRNSEMWLWSSTGASSFRENE